MKLPVLLLSILPLAAVAVEVDGVAARVGSAVILKSDIYKDMSRLGVDPSRYPEFRNVFIERELILKAAQDAKMTMQDWVIENRIRDIVNRSFGGDRNKLMEALAKDRTSYPEWHERMKNDMIVAGMRYQIVDRNVAQCSPAALREEYAAHPERYVVDHKVTVSAILLGPDDAAKKPEIDAALKTESFADLARKYSADAKAKEGGQWKDVVPEEVFRPEICAEIAKMPKGTISKWIELDGWSFLLRKDEESGGTRQSFAEAYDKIAANVREAEAERLYKAWIERLKTQTYIKVY